MVLNNITTDTEQDTFAIIDQFASKKDLLHPFAIDDTLLTQLNKGILTHSAILHFWPTEPAVFLGMVDTKLPDFNAGINFLNEAHYTPIIRPAGGLAVVSGPGIINFTLVTKPEERLSIDDAYEYMVTILDSIVKPYGLAAEAGEVPTSYCPGKYDVSINGKKIAGLAQRRIGQSIGIYVYLSLTGPQDERGKLIRHFYDYSLATQDEKQRFPIVDYHSMANIDQFIPEFADETVFKTALVQAVSHKNIDQAIRLGHIDISVALDKMKKRNKDVQALLTEA